MTFLAYKSYLMSEIEVEIAKVKPKLRHIALS